MQSCDVLIVGGGPAGSTCAWQLRQAGYDVLIIDKSRFPRDKICAGWITPQVVETLQLDLDAYAQDYVLQPINAFHTGILGRPTVVSEFSKTVSYGIRRCEFDHYLLQRAGVPTLQGTPVKSMERTPAGWLVNGQIQAKLIVGAGGHFCPVARMLRTSTTGPEAPVVTAVEAEFPISSAPGQADTIGTAPQLYFCADLSGYGWCVRKGDYLNIGIGLVDSRETSSRLPQLLEVLESRRSFTGEVPIRFRGHAYRLYDGTRAALVDDRLILIGDSAGLAYPQSGEGIRPAIESGVLAARQIQAVTGDYSRERLLPYEEQVRARFGGRPAKDPNGWGSWLPASWKQSLAGSLMRNAWFARHVVVERWFLHTQQPALRL